MPERLRRLKPGCTRKPLDETANISQHPDLANAIGPEPKEGSSGVLDFPACRGNAKQLASVRSAIGQASRGTIILAEQLFNRVVEIRKPIANEIEIVREFGVPAHFLPERATETNIVAKDCRD